MKITFLGDIMFGRGVTESIDKNGYLQPFGKVKSILANSNLVIANLESPLTNASVQIPGKDIQTTFKANPDYVNTLLESGINAVTIANNHITDYNEAGLTDTINLLTKNNILYTGAGRNLSEAIKPIIYRFDGCKIGIFAYNDFRPFVKFAKKNSFGVAPFDYDVVINSLNYFEKELDMIFISVHWGIDYYDYPIPRSIELAKNLLKIKKITGIIGHHPHYLQPLIFYGNKFIFSSLGNCLFDEPSAKSREGIIFSLNINGTFEKYFEFIPFRVDNDFQINKLSDEENKLLISGLDKIKNKIENNDVNYKNMDNKWIIYVLYYALKLFNPSLLYYIIKRYSFIKIFTAIILKSYYKFIKRTTTND